MDYSPQGRKKLDMTEHVRAHPRTHARTQEWRLSGRRACQILSDTEKEKVRAIFFFRCEREIEL